MATQSRTTEELEALLGSQIRAARLDQDIDQASLARLANVSLTALKDLEHGRGSSLRTLVRVVRALGRLDWLEDLFIEPGVSPVALARAREGIKRPQRASGRRGQH